MVDPVNLVEIGQLPGRAEPEARRAGEELNRGAGELKDVPSGVFAESGLVVQGNSGLALVAVAAKT